MHSIRRRLLAWQIGALLVTGLLASTLTYALAWHGFNRIRDYGLEQIAYSVLRHGVRAAAPRAAADGAEPRPAAPPSADDGADEDLGQFVSQIWHRDGQLVYASIAEGGPPLQPPGFHIVTWQGDEWRVYTLADRQQTVQVAVTSANRLKAFAELVPWLLVPLGLLVLLLTLLLHTAAVRALRPLDGLRREIAERDVLTLHEVPTQGLPAEVAPLADALNRLMARVDGLLVGQRRFIADAAHELNTPLAAVKLQAQLVRRTPPQERQEMLDRLDGGIERAIHLVQQLLQLARLEPDALQGRPQRVRLDELAAAGVAAFSARADACGVDLGLAASDAVQVVADPQALRVLLENLLDNALRHTPAGRAIDVRVARDDGHAVLTVSDQGPGIPAPDRPRALQRFVRLEGPAGQGSGTGSGLGLAIVASIVERCGGRLDLLDTPGGGLTVRVALPASPADVVAPG